VSSWISAALFLNKGDGSHGQLWQAALCRCRGRWWRFWCRDRPTRFLRFENPTLDDAGAPGFEIGGTGPVKSGLFFQRGEGAKKRLRRIGLPSAVRKYRWRNAGGRIRTYGEASGVVLVRRRNHRRVEDHHGGSRAFPRGMMPKRLGGVCFRHPRRKLLFLP